MIKVLDSFVADKIAAGEVIERPVSAVKELVENSIDAGAKSIIVEIRGGGKSYIRVTDDGCGISSDEAETAFLRHATSKISGIADLDNIVSLGFRGEALASISAVSRLTMVTRTDNDLTGIKIVLHGGKVVSRERTGCNKGTTVIVEDLFYNTPARRKFMKTDSREATAVIELIQQYAVCYAGIRFMMVNNGMTLFSTGGDGDVQSVIRTLYPLIAGKSLLPVESAKVNGFVSDPGSTMTTRKGQIFFVNGRLVSSPVIEKGIEEGYQGRIFSGFPAAILFIEADPSEIDVNIHPGKQEIRFLRQDDVKREVADAVSRTVMSGSGIPKGFVKNVESSFENKLNVDIQEADVPKREETEQTSIREFLKTLDKSNVSYEQPETHETAEEIPAAAEVRERPEPSYKPVSSPAPFDFDDLIFKGYVFNTYIIMQSGDELYIFDQHAAHERVFYEKFMRGYNNSAHSPQPILTSFTISVSNDVYSISGEWLGDLIRMGYDIEDFGDCTFIVRGIPPYMSAGEAEGFARGYAEAAGEAVGSNRVVIDKLITRSCKSAVKAHDVLSEHEITDLMSELAKCENPYSCPHGRPTFIRISSYDIERSFRRR